MSDFTPRPGRFTGRHMLIIMITFFGVIISVNLLMAYAASQAWTGLVVKNSYVASQNFNADMVDVQRQKDLGWQAGLELRRGIAVVSLVDNGLEGKPLQNLTVTLLLSRPTHEGEDRTVSLGETEPGHYRAEIDLKDGLWSAEIKARSASGESFRQIHRFVVNAGTGS